MTGSTHWFFLSWSARFWVFACRFLRAMARCATCFFACSSSSVAVEVAADVDGSTRAGVTATTGVVGGDGLVVGAQHVAVGVRGGDGGADSAMTRANAPAIAGVGRKLRRRRRVAARLPLDR